VRAFQLHQERFIERELASAQERAARQKIIEPVLAESNAAHGSANKKPR
jgi:hypothetical protein